MLQFGVSDTPQGNQAVMEAALSRSIRALVQRQHPDGYWCFEL